MSDLKWNRLSLSSPLPIMPHSALGFFPPINQQSKDTFKTVLNGMCTHRLFWTSLALGDTLEILWWLTLRLLKHWRSVCNWIHHWGDKPHQKQAAALSTTPAHYSEQLTLLSLSRGEGEVLPASTWLQEQHQTRQYTKDRVHIRGHNTDRQMLCWRQSQGHKASVTRKSWRIALQSGIGDNRNKIITTELVARTDFFHHLPWSTKRE